ncbi:MAG: hypothetical protein KKD74_10450 [Bacteroidetes bacterium]|nr:hypothetical protein [Bacteroidota bacterium]
MRKGVKQGCFVLIILLMILPFVQQHFNWPRMHGLKGAISKPVMPKLSFQALYHGTYQDSLNTYLENHIGYRPDLVRLHNQLHYSLFDTVNAMGVVRGKDGYLYEMNYIKALYGIDFIGEEKIKADVERTAVVDEWLRRHNKGLLVVLAPGKASFFPEYVPERLKPDTVKESNYAHYHALLKARGVSVIGCNEWFLSMKDTSRFALYPKCGIHWSYYGLGLVFDSVFRSMERITGRDFVDFSMQNISSTKKLRSPDRDLWEGMNIMVRPDDYAMTYPEYHFESLVKQNMPRVITVADSYYWQWFGGGYALRGFSTNSFWYYNAQIYAPDGSPPLDRKSVDLMTEISHTDIILLLQTDANMNRFGFGFIDELYQAIIEEGDGGLEKAAEIQKIIEGIRSNKEYMQMVREKAAKRGISEEEMLIIDAGWVWRHKHEAVK